jgi:hypothetical protein
VNGRAHHPLAIFARSAGVVALALILTVYLSGATRSDELFAVVPWFCAALLVHIAPPFVAPGTDIFSPLGIVGIQSGLAIGSMLASASTNGELSFSALGFMASQQRIELTRSVAVLLIVAQVSYLTGYYLSRGRLFGAILPKVRDRRWDGRRVLVAIALSTLSFCFVYWMFQREMGGALFDVSELSRGKAILREHESLSWMSRGIGLGFVPVLLLGCAAIASRSRPMLIVTGVAFIVISVLVARVGQRATAFTAGLCLLVVFHFLWRRVPVLLVAGLLLVAVVSVNILSEYRAHGVADTTLMEGMSKPITSAAAHEGDRQRLTVLGVIMHTFPERHDYLMGESYYGLVASLVPRWLWPDKAKYFVWRDTKIIYNITGLPAPTPLPGVLFANFSWAGVVLGMALLGAFHRSLYRYVQEAPGDPGSALIYIAILGSFTPTLLGVSQTLQWAVPVVVLVLLVSRAPARQSALHAAGTAQGAPAGLPVVATLEE